MADEDRRIVSARVAERARALRMDRGLTTHQKMAEALTAQGWPTNRSTVVRFESGKRGITVDDLVALAVALNVSPGWLLLPPETGNEEIPLVGSVTTPAWAAWQWVDGLDPLPTLSEDEGYNTPEESLAFQAGRPPELRQREQHPAARAVKTLHHRVRRVLHHAERPRTDKGDLGLETFETALRLARQALQRVSNELDELEQSASDPRGGRI